MLQPYKACAGLYEKMFEKRKETAEKKRKKGRCPNPLRIGTTEENKDGIPA